MPDLSQIFSLHNSFTKYVIKIKSQGDVSGDLNIRLP